MSKTQLPHDPTPAVPSARSGNTNEATLATTPMPDARITFAELAASFYLWLLAWLVLWTIIPAVALGWEPVLIVSGSMGPVITAGDMVLIGAPPVGESLAVGTVVTFRSPDDPDGLITHRIDGVRPDGLYRTRGDANGAPDSTPIAHEDVVGVGRMMVPLIGLPLLWLSNDLMTFGMFALMTIGAVIAASTARSHARHTVQAQLAYVTDEAA